MSQSTFTESEERLVNKTAGFLFFSVVWLFVQPFIVGKAYDGIIAPMLVQHFGTAPILPYWHRFWILFVTCSFMFTKFEIDSSDDGDVFIQAIITGFIELFLTATVNWIVYTKIIIVDFSCLVDLPTFTLGNFFLLTIAFAIVFRKFKFSLFTDKELDMLKDLKE